MKNFLNYLGQLRLYSLVDLILLLVVVAAPSHQLFGVIILHVGFLAYLESKHKHSYRLVVPKWISYSLYLVGAVLYGKIEALGYICFSYLYTRKTKSIGYLAPLFRSLQNMVIIGGIVGYTSYWFYLVGVVFFARNLLGDFRDIEKDKNEGMKTLPIICGFTKSIKNIHLIGTILSSLIWWSLSSLSFACILLVVVIQVSTYRLTPR